MSNNINLEQKLEYKGYWYLPSSPENKVAGVITYYPGEKIVLELIGCFDNSISSLLECKEESVIHGKTSDAKEITLLQCFQSSSVNFNADFPIVQYNCSFIVIGKHINSLYEKGNYWVSFRIPELTLWCYPAALNNNVRFNDQDCKITDVSVSLNFNTENNEDVICNVQIDDNTSLLLKKDVFYDSSKFFLNPQFEQYTYAEIVKHSEASINELMADVHNFERFISVASFDVVESTDITLYDKDIFKQGKYRKIYKEINLIHRGYKLKNQQKTKADFLFRYTTIKNVYPEIIKNWFHIPADLYPIRSHLISSLERKSVWGSVDFLIIIQAIEGFWWRFKDNDYKIKNSISKKYNTDLNTILTKLIEEFDDIELLNNCCINIEAVVDSRHYYSHFVEQSKKPKKLDGEPLIKEAKKLRVLLICCILSFIGFDDSQINEIFKTSSLNLH